MKEFILPETSIEDYTLFVDQEVNLIRKLTLDEALVKHVPEDKREAVREMYNKWHERSEP